MVQQTVEDRGGQDLIVGEDLRPVVDGELAGNEGGAASVAVLEDLEWISSFGLLQELESKVVDKQRGSLLKAVEDPCVRTVGTSDAQLVEEPTEAEVGHGEAEAGALASSSTRLMKQKAAQPPVTGGWAALNGFCSLSLRRVLGQR